MKRAVMMLLACIGLAVGSADAAKVEQVWPLDGHENEQGDFFKKSIERMAALPGFQCHFDQMMVFTDGGGQRYSGDLAVLKPKRFRWQYEKPYEQFYISDGYGIWHYEPDLMQAERLDNLEAVDPAVMKLLDGRISTADLKVLQKENASGQQTRRYQVSIKGSEPVWLGFSRHGDLISIERQDLLGNRNRMSLSKCSYIAPSENLFSFTPPDGVDVLDMRSSK
ncbi:outer membrane lipoprotein carrier protein [Mariprofundus micogutta]|uniref:Outer membrane lipoprotein carrier protein n=1 Tax=Mariprofundus micogutta TaxID=1921010 RepID=A0A1L8CP64_9PROT|nr:outer-membrane lipoprotein carrier protein LolA [Mariprofundus micogutta]GAV20712.1 outer membrane lipoprotein carrier protein [Mariprofundus micogutta]